MSFRKISKGIEEAIILNYYRGFSLRQCGRFFGLTHEGIRKVLQRNKEEIRPPHINKRVNL